MSDVLHTYVLHFHPLPPPNTHPHTHTLHKCSVFTHFLGTKSLFYLCLWGICKGKWIVLQICYVSPFCSREWLGDKKYSYIQTHLLSSYSGTQKCWNGHLKKKKRFHTFALLCLWISWRKYCRSLLILLIPLISVFYHKLLL